MSIRKSGFSLIIGLGFAGVLAMGVARATAYEPKKPGEKGKSKKEGKKKAPGRSWGKRPKETQEQYDKRRAQMIKRCKEDKLNMYSVRNLLFLVRTDVSEEFTATLALYMEELHRAYQQAFSKMGAPPSNARDIVEIVCYFDRGRYVKEGGSKSSGGHFHPYANADPKYWNRPPGWPAGQFRLVLFTDGVDNFDDWEKTTMKHEAAHMELQLRLGYSALDSPRWWNEGMAACFEYWDFEKTTDENFALIPKRGRYAPVIRRLVDTPMWKDFNHVWTIDGASWHNDMNSVQGFLNYSQAWSLAAFMFNQGVKGKKFFNQIFNLSVRMGGDTKTYRGVKKRGWEEAFSMSDRADLEKAWIEWVRKNLPKDERVPGEEAYLLRQGFDPEADTIVPISEKRAGEMYSKPRKKKGKKAEEDD